jgi:hypothetical protein
MKTGQFDVGVVIATLVFLLILAPIMLHLVSSFNSQFQNLSSTIISPETNATIEHIDTTFTNFWDWFVIMWYVMAIIILFISSFFVEINPIFFGIYVVFAMVLVLLTDGLNDMLVQIYQNTTLLATDVANMPYTSWFAGHMIIITMMVIMITGIIMFAKVIGARGRPPKA